MLAGSKYRSDESYQGISFFNPFFFLLVDSSLLSTGGAFTLVEAFCCRMIAGLCSGRP